MWKPTLVRASRLSHRPVPVSAVPASDRPQKFLPGSRSTSILPPPGCRPRLRYSLRPAPDGTVLRVDDSIVFRGLGKLAAPIASRDVSKRWATSLERLRAAAEAGA